MKLWYDINDVDLSKFHSEQFLIAHKFDFEVFSSDKDLGGSDLQYTIPNIVHYSSLEECDYILYPKKVDVGICKYIDLAKKHNKKVLCFYNDDNDKPMCLNDVLFYRTSFNLSKRKKFEYSMPAWSNDFSDVVCSIIRYKKIRPVVSFCGALTHPSRKACIDKLKRCSAIETSFIIRDNFWGGDIHGDIVRAEYIENMNDSDLVLCCRGAGNFSYRLYECLSLGKIPIIVNDDTPLPCYDRINWNSFIITTVENIVDDIIMFWNMTEKVFIQKQEYARYVYDEFLSPSGFARYIDTKLHA